MALGSGTRADEVSADVYAEWAGVWERGGGGVVGCLIGWLVGCLLEGGMDGWGRLSVAGYGFEVFGFFALAKESQEACGLA